MKQQPTQQRGVRVLKVIVQYIVDMCWVDSEECCMDVTGR